jgi:hypothetical protein
MPVLEVAEVGDELGLLEDTLLCERCASHYSRYRAKLENLSALAR